MVSPALQRDKPPAEPTKPADNVLKIRAADEPDPALRYRFWPAPELRRQANPIPFVSRAILLSVQAKNTPALRQEFIQKYDSLLELPVDQLPAEEVRQFLAKFGSVALRELARAENLTALSYDLRLDELSASEMIATVLPEVQESRTLARLLALRARLAVAEGRWDDFARDIRLGLRLAECTGRGNDFLIGRLVGYAITGVMLEVVQEAIGRPGSPNLYWALASMPEARLSEIRDSIEFESAIVARMFNDVRSLPDTAIGEDAARMKLLELFAEAGETLDMLDDVDGFRTAQMMAGFYVVSMADPSRDMLAGTETWGDKAYELSAPEAVLRGMQLKFDRIRDSWVKWSLLPPESWPEFKDKAELQVSKRGQTDLVEIMMTQLTPAVDAARRASQRVIQARNKLLTIEAIRMHAAQQGELPKGIEKLRPVPAWMDGLSMQPFRYTRTSPTTATLLAAERYRGDEQTMIQLELIK